VAFEGAEQRESVAGCMVWRLPSALRDSGWNEISEEEADLMKNIKIVCQHCYEDIRNKCETHYL